MNPDSCNSSTNESLTSFFNLSYVALLKLCYLNSPESSFAWTDSRVSYVGCVIDEIVFNSATILNSLSNLVRRV